MDESMIPNPHLLITFASFVISGTLTFFITRKFGRKRYDYLLILSPVLFWIPISFSFADNEPVERILGQAFGISLIGGIIGYFVFRKKNKK